MTELHLLVMAWDHCVWGFLLLLLLLFLELRHLLAEKGRFIPLFDAAMTLTLSFLEIALCKFILPVIHSFCLFSISFIHQLYTKTMSEACTGSGVGILERFRRCPCPCPCPWGLPWWFSGKESICQCRRLGFNPWVEKIDPQKEEMAIHSSIVAWEVTWTEEPGRVQSMELQESDTTEWLNMYLLLRDITPRGELTHNLRTWSGML